MIDFFRRKASLQLIVIKFWQILTEIFSSWPRLLDLTIQSSRNWRQHLNLQNSRLITKLVKFPWRDVRGTMLESTTQESLEFCKAYLQRKDNLRSDRQELAELVVLFLSDNQCNIKIRKPGACSHARFFSKCIYCVKTELLIQQLPYNVDTVIGLAELKEITIFVCCFYAQWYLLSHEAIRAPYMDISAIQTMLR